MKVMKANIKYLVAASALVMGLGLTSFSAQAQRNEKRKEYQKEYKYSEKGHKKYNNKRNYYSQKNYRENDRWDSRRYNKHKRYDDSRFAYHHPKYGNVYKRFNEHPVRLRYAHGDLYYHAGHYYRFYPRVGYVRVAVPAGYIFADLPGRYERVSYGGHLYFRVGDMMFERCAQGYRLAPQFSLNVSARF
jgi:hypothetical protein